MHLAAAEYPAICRALDMLDFDAGGDLADPDRSIPAEWQALLPAVEGALRSLQDEQLERFVCSIDANPERYGPQLGLARQLLVSYQEGWALAPTSGA